MSKLRVLDLFSGIGGFSLGLERTGGFETVAFCEIEEFPRRVLAKHWPDVPCYRDVRELTAARLAADGIAVDVICGGFPCQDISEAGKGLGLAGDRSGLWSEIARLAGELRPRFVIVENVAALLGRGLGTVLGDLAALGYDAEWHCIPASAIGAPHRRDRIWIVAYPDTDGGRCAPSLQPDGGALGRLGTPQRNDPDGLHTPVADANRSGRGQSAAPAAQARQPLGSTVREESAPVARPSRETLALADCSRHEGARRELPRGRPIITREHISRDGQWPAEPAVGRVADGIPHWAHRIKSLGNAVVPQIPELIGHAILASLTREAA